MTESRTLGSPRQPGSGTLDLTLRSARSLAGDHPRTRVPFPQDERSEALTELSEITAHHARDRAEEAIRRLRLAEREEGAADLPPVAPSVSRSGR